MNGIASTTSAALGALACLAIGLRADPAEAANQKVIMALPNLGVSFAYVYIADAMGFWKDQGLDVEISVIEGAGALKALVAGDVEFAGTSGITSLVTAAMKQPNIAIANIHSQLNYELLLSPEAVKKTGLDPKTATEVERARAIKGMSIASGGGPNTVSDGFLRHIELEGGLVPDKDVTVSFLPDGAAAAALKTKQVDGQVISPPLTTIAEQGGYGINWVSVARGDLKDLNPIVYTTISALKPKCEKSPDICTRFLSGVTRALALMRSDPEKGLQAIGPTYKNMDPAVLKDGYLQQIAQLNPGDGKMTDAAFKLTQDFSIASGIMKPEQALSGFNGVAYTNAYFK